MSRRPGVGSRAVLILVALVLAAGCASGAAPGRPSGASPGAGGTHEPGGTRAPGATATLGIDELSGLPIVALADLPPEAADAVALIDRGGPFPYDQDGAAFQNREGILPARPTGYYHEYTVETPGSPDRGPRRIVEGARDELYWTDDHYASFSRIQR